MKYGVFVWANVYIFSSPVDENGDMPNEGMSLNEFNKDSFNRQVGGDYHQGFLGYIDQPLHGRFVMAPYGISRHDGLFALANWAREELESIGRDVSGLLPFEALETSKY